MLFLLLIFCIPTQSWLYRWGRMNTESLHRFSPLPQVDYATFLVGVVSVHRSRERDQELLTRGRLGTIVWIIESREKEGRSPRAAQEQWTILSPCTRHLLVRFLSALLTEGPRVHLDKKGGPCLFVSLYRSQRTAFQEPVRRQCSFHPPNKRFFAPSSLRT